MRPPLIIASGFAAGMVLGGLILIADNFASPRKNVEANNEDIAVQTQVESAANPLKSDVMGRAVAPALDQETLFQILAAEVAQGQGGRISRHELNAVAQIAMAARGREQQFLSMRDSVSQSQGGTISIHQMMAIAGVANEPAKYQRSPSQPEPVVQFAPSNPYGSSMWSSNSSSPTSDSGESASKRWMRQNSQILSDSGQGATNARTGEHLNPAGDGYTAGGIYYVPSGPDGVVSSRTGQYSPIIPEN